MTYTEETVPQYEEDADFPPKNDLWNCIDPCAFLCYCVQTNVLAFDDAVKLTLDNFGWCNDDGFPDYAKMQREFNRVQSLKT